MGVVQASPFSVDATEQQTLVLLRPTDRNAQDQATRARRLLIQSNVAGTLTRISRVPYQTSVRCPTRRGGNMVLVLVLYVRVPVTYIRGSGRQEPGTSYQLLMSYQEKLPHYVRKYKRRFRITTKNKTVLTFPDT